jgi:hypothetical protein
MYGTTAELSIKAGCLLACLPARHLHALSMLTWQGGPQNSVLRAAQGRSYYLSKRVA